MNTDQQISRKDFDTIPKSDLQLRACLVCSLIKNFDQFEMSGCENCEDFLNLRNARDRVYELTSANWSGMISLIAPTDSWAAKWQYLQYCVPGCYAISVKGSLPKGLEKELRNSGIPYRNRDRSERF